MDIMPNITTNPQMIASAGTTFMVVIEHNVAWMSKQIVDLQNRIYASKKRATIAEQGKKMMEEENAKLCLLHTRLAKFQAVVTLETKILGETMEVVYEEMKKLHHTIEPIVTIQNHSKERVAILKEAMIVLDKIHEWYEKHPEASIVVPRNDCISMQNTSVQLRIKVQSREKLAKDAEKVLASYR